MGKPTTAEKKKKKKPPSKDGTHSKSCRSTERGAKVLDNDASIFIEMGNEMKEQGNRLFQKKDYDGALVKYDKAIKLLPNNHIDIAYLRSNVAACYMQMGAVYYPKAIHECNLALLLSPKYTKALLKRARCFEALHMFEIARKDVDAVLTFEPNNLTALELSEKIKNSLVEVEGIRLDVKEVVSPSVQIMPARAKSKNKKKKKNKTVDKVAVETAEPIAEMPAAAVKAEDSMKAVKLVFGEDIRFALIPRICSLSQLREIVRCRFPRLKAVLIKYKDEEGDLITITTSEELSWADDSSDPQGSLRLYVNEVKPEHEPLFHDTNTSASDRNLIRVLIEEQENLCCIDEWIVDFAQLFKNHVGVDSDAYLDLHQLGMKLYSEAMEETVTGEEAMRVFDLASGKFQEMAALALFNRGNVLMSRARKRVFLVENDSEEAALAKVKSSYEWAKGEYERAGSSYEEAMKIKPDFYEGLFALAHQQFEQAKLTWYFALGSKVDLGTWPSKEVLGLFNNAEENMERAMETWEEVEEEQQRFKPCKEKVIMEKMGLGQFSADEAAESAVNMRSQVHILWGRILYERSTVEFKLSLPTWEECLMIAIEKFKLAGASPTDIAVVVKNHSANEASREGLGFKIDEIIQAWNEMYDAKRWTIGFPSFRLEPLFRRRVPKLHESLEHAR